jgi:2-dehydro-3-deoxy-D-arabinonate dehydratase
MRIARFIDDQGLTRVGYLLNDFLTPLPGRLTHWLDAPVDPSQLPHFQSIPLSKAQLLPPIDRQEVWAAGVTYLRSKVARKSESSGAASFYDLVYTAERPELFFKSTAERVVGPGLPLRIRRDSRWSVPEPELALVIAPDARIVGYTLANDMSARDIEGENPLYLPQAKIYDQSCALGPTITLASQIPDPAAIQIQLAIHRHGAIAFHGQTSLNRMVRPFEELVSWLFRDHSFPDGVILLTGTGIVPPDDFSLEPGDQIHISSPQLGDLCNPVIRSAD